MNARPSKEKPDSSLESPTSAASPGPLPSLACRRCETHFQLSRRPPEGKRGRTRRHLCADTPLFPCDWTKDEEVDTFFDKVKEITLKVDLLLHSIAFAPKEALEGVSSTHARSLSHRAQHQRIFARPSRPAKAEPLHDGRCSIVAMTYYGAEKVVSPLQRHGASQRPRSKPAPATLPMTWAKRRSE